MSNYDSPQANEFFAALGRLTISWAHLELGLDSMIHVIHHGLGNRQYENETPRALSRKLKYLRKAFKRMPLPEETQAQLADWLDEIETASEARHDMIHGAVIEHSEETGDAQLIRLLHNKTGLKQKRVSVTTKSILEAAVKAQKLSGYALKYGVGIQDVLVDIAQQSDEQDR